MLLILSLACAPGSVALPESVVPESAPPAHEDPLDQVPGSDADTGLCQIRVTCPDTIPNEPGITCRVRVHDADGLSRYDGDAELETRGRSSSSFPKPQYGMELHNSDGEPQNIDLLGMGAESDWILNGAYIDRALFRNVLAWDLFREMGHYAPRTRFCWMTLDGDDMGIYHLGERVKASNARLNLTDDEAGQSFLLKLDDEGGVRDNVYGNGYWELEWPQAPTQAQTEGVVNFLRAWDTAIEAEGSLDAVMDPDMAVDLVLLEEFMKNNDGWYLSLYLFRDQGGLAGWVPWDLDLTLSQPSYNNNESPEEWILYRPTFINAFDNDPAFQQRLADRWAALREGPFSDASIDARIDAYVETMGESAYQNFEVWPIEDITFGWGGANYLYDISSYDAELERVRAWIPRRTAWIDDHIARW